MTIIVATRDRIVSDSKLVYGESAYEVGKIFRLKDRSLMATAGDGRLTHAFETALCADEAPEPQESKDDESFEGVVLRPDGALVLYTDSYSPYVVGNPHVVIGSDAAAGAAMSWLKHGATAEEAVARAIEVDASCGGRIVTVMLHEAPKKSGPATRHRKA